MTAFTKILTAKQPRYSIIYSLIYEKMTDIGFDQLRKK